MFDIQHDSPVPIHEQLTGQIRAHIASGALKAGAQLAEYRVLAQALLTNPQVVARAYDDLAWENVLKKTPAGAMEVTAGAQALCRARLQDLARQMLRQAAAQAVAAGLPDAEIVSAVEQHLAAARAATLSQDELRTAIQKSTHERHRASQGVQDLSRQDRPRSP